MIENIENIDTARSSVADDFEAALAATATDVVEIVAEEVETALEPSGDLEVLDVSEDGELEEENDEKRKRRTEEEEKRRTEKENSS